MRPNPQPDALAGAKWSSAKRFCDFDNRLAMGEPLRNMMRKRVLS
jgi:hypothetical protein